MLEFDIIFSTIESISSPFPNLIHNQLMLILNINYFLIVDQPSQCSLKMSSKLPLIFRMTI